MKDKEAFIDFKSTSVHIADSRALGTPNTWQKNKMELSK
jgi:hypothetical protein